MEPDLLNADDSSLNERVQHIKLKPNISRTGATLKSAIRRSINQGNDVLNASSMKKGIETMMKSVKYKVSVVEKAHVKGTPGIGSYSNFSFEEGGICVWIAHGIGEGLLIKNNQIPAINIRYISQYSRNLMISHFTSCLKENQTQKI